VYDTRRDVNKDMDKDQTFKDKDQTPKDKDQTFKAKDQVNYNQYRVKLEKIMSDRT